jgi:hypothetical protein
LVAELVGCRAIAEFDETGVLLHAPLIGVFLTGKRDPAVVALLVQHQGVQHHVRRQRGSEGAAQGIKAAGFAPSRELWAAPSAASGLASVSP